MPSLECQRRNGSMRAQFCEDAAFTSCNQLVHRRNMGHATWKGELQSIVFTTFVVIGTCESTMSSNVW